MLNSFYLFLFPIFAFCFLFLCGIIAVDVFFTLTASFSVACIVFAITDTMYLSCVGVILTLILAGVLRKIAKKVRKLDSNVKSTKVIVVGKTHGGSSIVFDGTSLQILDINEDVGSVVTVNLNCF